MACFSLASLERLIIWLIIIGAIFVIIRLLVPAIGGAWQYGADELPSLFPGHVHESRSSMQEIIENETHWP
jgi:hypothetical protein